MNRFRFSAFNRCGNKSGEDLNRFFFIFFNKNQKGHKLDVKEEVKRKEVERMTEERVKDPTANPLEKAALRRRPAA